MFLLIDKPKGITSHDVIDEVRRITGEKKVGHAGTLDPLATGLLIVGVERSATKRLGEILKKRKAYEAEIVLGKETDTLDAEGKVVNVSRRQAGASPADAKAVAGRHPAKSVRDDTTGMKSLPAVSKVKMVLKEFVGRQEQVPPKHSAIKIKGKKAYELARKGKEVKLKPRQVEIFSLELISYEYPTLAIKTEVSSGTYIRSLARDIGRKLGTFAYLNNLRRTRIGKVSVDDAVTLKELEKDWKKHTKNFSELN